MSDLAVLVNQTVTRLAVLVGQLAVHAGRPDITDEVCKELLRMAERADLEMAYLEETDE